MALVLDFDGNLTDVEAEGAPFVAAYGGYVAKLMQLPVDGVLEDLERITQEALASDPANFGWVYGNEGLIMAPASVDPYLRSNAAARRLLQHSEVFARPGAIGAFLDLIFGFAYGKTDDVPKDGTFELLVQLYELKGLAAIVSNSGTGGVTRKVANMLGNVGTPSYEWWVRRIFGLARKMDPDEYIDMDPGGNPITDPNDRVLWDPEVQVEVTYNGFPRATVIKRPHYLKRLRLLKAQWEQELGRSLSWAEIVVSGDIFELDLCLPLELGCHIGFMVNDRSPQWEIDFVEQHPRGRVLRNVNEILPFHDEVQDRLAA